MTQCGVSDKNVQNLESGFVNPPDSARPRVWWHWMNGNITKDGIRADLDWMSRIGIRGFQNFDAALMTPQVVEKRLVYMTPEWKDAFRFTTRLADSLGLEMAIAGSPGWSESGGPWVKPEEAMKKYVWSETRVEGGNPFKGILKRPPSITGSFQNLPLRDEFSLTGGPVVEPPEYYADAAVVAYRLPDSDLSLNILQPKVTSSGGKFTLSALTDGDLSTSYLLPYTKPGENAWIMFEFAKPQTMEALSIVGGGYGGQFGFGGDRTPRTLETSEDGKIFRKVIDISRGGIEQKTLTFSPVTAKYFRFTWKTPMPQPAINIGAVFGFDTGPAPKGPAGTQIAELVLYPLARINRFEEKAAFATATDLYTAFTPEVKTSEVVKKSEVIDLSSKMNPDGTLEWTPPEGTWNIVRLGYSLTGHKNSPASPEATGLEVDKLNASHVKAYFENYLDQYKDATGGLMGKRGLQYIITDSWEAGTQNWTDNMMEEFAKRRGYDMLQWIPVLTGHIVESAEESDRFLWDFRRTLSDLVAENHYDQLTEILKERDMGRYSESHESGRAFIGDGMEVKRKAAVPMSATWTPGGLDPGTEVATRYKADVRESASVAHLYGQNLVAAESMTAIGSAWAWSPETLKPTADMEMANGLNRFVIHTSVHQPVDDKIPGLGLGPFGQWFTRHETWAEQAKPWIDYLSRSSYMLQQGKFVADVLYYYGEDNNITALFGSKLPEIPAGYNWDFVNADALTHIISLKNGVLSSPGGTEYRVLALDSNSRYMSLPVLQKIRDLVNDGAIISGPKPVSSPSLKDDENEFKTIADNLWPITGDVKTYGKGKVFSGQDLEQVFKSLNIAPDFSYSGSNPYSRLLFVHRKMKSADIYWIDNRLGVKDSVTAKFRIDGMRPEIWDPVSCEIEHSSFKRENGITTVPLVLGPGDAVFVVFREKTNSTSAIVPKVSEKELEVLSGDWDLSFQKDRGAPDSIKISELTSWSNSKNDSVKYFSGTAAYVKHFEAPAAWFAKGSQIWIDLGDVKNIAEVVVNGKSMGIVWRKPFRVNITSALSAGNNRLEVKVTNLWINRLIGDAQPGVTKKITYTTMPFYRANSPLKPSGIMGPVRIYSTIN
jgi:hypothetical protein